MISTTLRRTRFLAAVSVAAFITVACSTASSPTAPTPAPATTPAPTPAPAPTPVPAPTGPGTLEITIVPSAAPWSSEPIEGCSLPNTWRYEQILKNTGGTRLTVSDRADSFDGVQVSVRSGLGIVLAPGAQHPPILTRWCSANSTEHRTQTTFSGSDDANNRINVAGPVVRLMAR